MENMIDEIKFDFKSVGFGGMEKNFNPEDATQYNSYDVTITYNGKTCKELYGNKWYGELKENVDDIEVKQTMKIDILNHIVSDCNVPDTFEHFVKKIKEFELSNGVSMTMDYKTVYGETYEQMKKYINVFGREGIEQLRKALLEYRDKIPESKVLIRFDESWTEMFRDGDVRIATESNDAGIRRVEDER